MSLIGCLFSSASPAAPADTPSALESNPTGWEDLLPDKDLHGWHRIPLTPDKKLNAKNPWSVDVANKVLVCDGVGVHEMFLQDKERGDGIYHVEWRFKKVDDNTGYNSGVYVRSGPDGSVWVQVQVAHLNNPPRMGDVFGDVPVEGKVQRVVVAGDGDQRVKPPGQWNTYEVTCKGPTISVWINGAVTTTWNKCPVSKGLIGLQSELWFIEFRNLKFKSLP
jgi:hypothetical protein